MHRVRITAAAICVVLLLLGCTRPVRVPTETPQHAADRILASILRREPDPQMPAPYGPSAVAGRPEPVIDGYYPALIPVDSIVQHDRQIPPGGLFAAMRSAPRSTRYYLVPIIQSGEPVAFFSMQLESGEWTQGMRSSESSPSGYFHKVKRIERTLQQRLGPRTETRVALLLPSGLIFVVGNNGSEELAAYLGFENAGPGIRGFGKYLPQSGDLYDADQLRGLLDPSGPSPKPVEQ